MSEGSALFELHCKAYGIPFESEYRFDSSRKWRFDLAIHFAKIAVEINGGTWISGRHNRGSSIEKEYEKLNAAAILGWRVLQFTTDSVKSGAAIECLQKALGLPINQE
jgi:very-short-patch-repair endonuclease